MRTDSDPVTSIVPVPECTGPESPPGQAYMVSLISPDNTWTQRDNSKWAIFNYKNSKKFFTFQGKFFVQLKLLRTGINTHLHTHTHTLISVDTYNNVIGQKTDLKEAFRFFRISIWSLKSLSNIHKINFWKCYNFGSESPINLFFHHNNK